MNCYHLTNSDAVFNYITLVSQNIKVCDTLNLYMLYCKHSIKGVLITSTRFVKRFSCAT